MRIALLVCALLLAACGSDGPRVPDWQVNAQSAAQRAVTAYLEGRSAVAEREFALARGQVASTGQPQLAIRVELLRCAAHVAALVFDDCAGFGALEADASAADRAYLAYLSGQAADAALLPEPQRAVATGGEAAALALADPVSRLVAAGALLRAGRASPALVDSAVETASAQGWRRPLLAWLQVQLARAGDGAEAERIRRRIALAQSPP